MPVSQLALSVTAFKPAARRYRLISPSHDDPGSKVWTPASRTEVSWCGGVAPPRAWGGEATTRTHATARARATTRPRVADVHHPVAVGRDGPWSASCVSTQ